MVIRHDGQSRSTHKSVFLDPSPDGFCHSAKLGVGTALNLIVALEFERDVVRPSLLALEKAIVESGHGSWGIYTKTLFTALRRIVGELRHCCKGLSTVNTSHAVFLEPLGRI
jgi:hypothetical protein